MSSFISVLRDPVPYHGALGMLASLTIEHVNAFVGLLVGLATLVYLCLRIGREWKNRNTSVRDE
jgi:hypothetical protein